MPEEEKIRIYGEVSPDHETKFLFIRGVFGSQNNGDALEKMIDRLHPEIKKEVSANGKKRTHGK